MRQLVLAGGLGVALGSLIALVIFWLERWSRESAWFRSVAGMVRFFR